MKKSILIVAVIVFIIVTGVLGNIIYNKLYTTRVNEEINNTLLKMGISPNEVDLSGLNLTGADPKEIYNLVYEEVVKYKTLQQTDENAQTKTIQSAETSPATYNCIADLTTKRGYIVIHGAGGPDAGETMIKNAVSADPQYGGFLYFTYDASQETLSTIATRFVSKYKEFAMQGYDKIIIYGQSAGGVIASYAAYQLGPSPSVEIHTLASPLNGYKFGPASEQISQQFSGLNKEIGLGIAKYNKPSDNTTVYHHKTVEDATLRSFCGSYASLCSPSVIQDNDVPGSFKYTYPNDTHESISATVVAKTLSCLK